MLKLINTKIALFDFDDTLCIHEKHGPSGHREYIKDMILGIDHWTDHGCTINAQLKSFMDICITQGIRIGLISYTDSYLHMQMKQKWVEENYQVKIENFCVGSFEMKIDLMQGLCDAYQYAPDEILFVDDALANLEAAEASGFQACTPMEVVNYINNCA